MQKHNILFTSCFGTLKGGGQRSLLLILKYLDRQRFRPLVAVPEEGELSHGCEELGIKTIAFPFPRVRSLLWGRVRSGVQALASLIQQEGVHIVHTESPREALYAGWAARGTGVKTVFHARVSDRLLLWDRLLYTCSDRIIAVSEGAASRFRPFDSKHTVEVIYNGVDLAEFAPVPQESDRASGVVIGYFGKVEPRKGLDVLINACRFLDIKVRTVIIGEADGAYLNKLKHLAEGLDISFEGYRRDIREAMAQVDVVVLPSVKPEGMPRMLIEGMAMAKCVIASDFPSHREAIGSDRKECLFRPGDHQGLSALLRGLLVNHEHRRVCGILGRKRAEEFFDIKRATKTLEGIYEQLLEEGMA